MAVKQISKIIIKKGLAEDLPVSLSEGEFAYVTDTGEVFIGAPNLSSIAYRGDISNLKYPYQNVKLMTEFDFPKAITTDYYTLGPLVRFSIPISSTYSTVYTFDAGIDTICANYSLYSQTTSTPIFVGNISIIQNQVYSNSLDGVSFQTTYSNNVVQLQAINNTTSILIMNMCGQTWLTEGTRNA